MKPLLPSLLFVCVASLGCASMQRQSLDETATLFHDDLRWGRLPTAEGTVDGAIRQAFTDHHRTWGSLVQVMDLEVESMRTSSLRGSVRLRVVWTRGDASTDLRESLVEEAWEVVDGSWKLRNEAVIAGDPGLFGTPTASRPMAAQTPRVSRTESASDEPLGTR